MWRYIARRVLQMIPVLIGTTFLIFTMVYKLPGDPIRQLSGDKEMPPSVKQALEERYNFDDPFVVQYLKYLLGLFQGDFGETLERQDVGQLISESWKVTAQLAVTAWIFMLVVGIVLGVISGLRKGKLLDTAVLTATTLVLSVPVFVVGYIAQIIFAEKLGWFPAVGNDDGWPMSYLLPGAVLGSFGLAYVTRLTRTSLIENMRADYVRTAKSKGLPQARVVVRHTLRNSLIPVVTYLGFHLGDLMAGAIVTEGVFGLPGVGLQIFNAIYLKDGPIVVGIATFLVLIFLVANLIVDILYGLLDPRIRYD